MVLHPPFPGSKPISAQFLAAFDIPAGSKTARWSIAREGRFLHFFGVFQKLFHFRVFFQLLMKRASSLVFTSYYRLNPGHPDQYLRRAVAILQYLFVEPVFPAPFNACGPDNMIELFRLPGQCLSLNREQLSGPTEDEGYFEAFCFRLYSMYSLRYSCCRSVGFIRISARLFSSLTSSSNFRNIFGMR